MHANSNSRDYLIVPFLGIPVSSTDIDTAFQEYAHKDCALTVIAKALQVEANLGGGNKNER